MAYPNMALYILFVIDVMQIGDFGRRGDFNQSEVARLLALKAADMDPDFIISVGDNMYPSVPASSLTAWLHVSDALLSSRNMSVCKAGQCLIEEV